MATQIRTAGLGLIAATVGLLVAFGVNLTPAQIGAITAEAAAAAAVADVAVRFFHRRSQS